MDCLECPNYWRTNIDESLCEECETHKQNRNIKEDNRNE